MQNDAKVLKRIRKPIRLSEVGQPDEQDVGRERSVVLVAGINSPQTQHNTAAISCIWLGKAAF